MRPGIHNFVAKTFQGLERPLADELNALGLQDVQPGRRVVKFRSDFAGMYRANYRCRTALNILWPVRHDRVSDEDQLYRSVVKIPWSDLFSVNKTILVRSTVNSKRFTHSHFINQKTKDAIADHFRRKTGRRPSVEKRHPDIVIDVHIRGEELTISLNSSGAPLFKRGYRREAVEAPLNEVLAAGILMLGGWDGKDRLVDPMCGSGTFSIEAAYMAAGRSPHHIRGEFSFEHWHRFDRMLWDEIREEGRPSSGMPEILASDHNGEAIRIARKNARQAGMSDSIRFRQQDFFEMENPGGRSVLIFNPPYDVRLTEEDIELLYQRIGDRLKQEWAGCRALIFSSHMDALKQIGLKPTKKITLFNGPLEGKLCIFDLYEGSRK